MISKDQRQRHGESPRRETAVPVWHLAVATVIVMLAVLLSTASIISHISRVEDKLDRVLPRLDAAPHEAAPPVRTAPPPPPATPLPGQIAPPSKSVY